MRLGVLEERQEGDEAQVLRFDHPSSDDKIK